METFALHVRSFSVDDVFLLPLLSLSLAVRTSIQLIISELGFRRTPQEIKVSRSYPLCDCLPSDWRSWKDLLSNTKEDN
jgi:hypothetical protein